MRWALLTNGKNWESFDNNQIGRPAEERLITTLNINDPEAPHYFERLMAIENWQNRDAEDKLLERAQRIQQDIRRRTKLNEIEKKLRSELESGFAPNEQGLRRAVDLTLEANERELASESFSQLASRLLNAAPTSEASDVFLQKVAQLHRHENQSTKLRVEFQDREFFLRSWRDLHAAIAEAFLALGLGSDLSNLDSVYKTTTERVKNTGEPYSESAFRQLSDGSYLFVGLSAKGHCQHCRRLLDALGCTPELIRIEYRDEIISLP